MLLESAKKAGHYRLIPGGQHRSHHRANKLGAALLMPRGLVQQEVRAQDLDLDDSEAIEVLAKKFQVSTVAMGNRLQNLRMLAYEN